MTQAESKQKIEGRFYPLRHSEWLTSCRELMLPKRNVLYYIRTLNPEGNQTLPRATETAKMLGLDICLEFDIRVTFGKRRQETRDRRQVVFRWGFILRPVKYHLLEGEVGDSDSCDRRSPEDSDTSIKGSLLSSVFYLPSPFEEVE